jgi:hypothetical protein
VPLVAVVVMVMPLWCVVWCVVWFVVETEIGVGELSCRSDV